MNHVLYHNGCTFVVQNPTVEDVNTPQWRKHMNLCPICNEKAVLNCKCPRLDSRCANGHEWHYCPVHHDKVNMGMSDHSKSDCTCGEKNEAS